MPKKRASAETSNDAHTKDGSDSIDDAKRSRLEPLYDTTLQDLPIELLESILIKAVAMEVLELKLARCARKEQADLVIGRLRTVCPQWNSVLTTDIFRREVHRRLQGQETNRFEILDRHSFRLNVSKVITLKDEIFLLCSTFGHDPFPAVINVYDRNNMAEVKDVIRLVPGTWPIDMAACNVSNCLYILNRYLFYRDCPSVFRIKKDEEHHFKMSQWLNNRDLSFPTRGPMSVASTGNLIILSSQETSRSDYYVPVYMAKLHCVSIFNSNGCMQHAIMLSPAIYGFRIINSVIQKSDGNLVLLAASAENNEKLLEIDTTGRILRQYQSPVSACNSIMCFAEVHGRFLVSDNRNRIKLFDPLFNPVEIADSQPPEAFILAPQIHFDSERNEIVRIETLKYVYYGYRAILDGSVVSFSRFTSE